MYACSPGLEYLSGELYRSASYNQGTILRNQGKPQAYLGAALTCGEPNIGAQCTILLTLGPPKGTPNFLKHTKNMLEKTLATIELVASQHNPHLEGQEDLGRIEKKLETSRL